MNLTDEFALPAVSFKASLKCSSSFDSGIMLSRVIAFYASENSRGNKT